MLVRVLLRLLLELGAGGEHCGLAAQRTFGHWVLFELIQVQLNTLGGSSSGHICAELLILLLRWLVLLLGSVRNVYACAASRHQSLVVISTVVAYSHGSEA